jgi:hypothetical protein
VLLRRVAPEIASGLFGSPLTGELTDFVTLMLPVSLYFALFEASPSGRPGTSDGSDSAFAIHTVGDWVCLGR